VGLSSAIGQGLMSLAPLLLAALVTAVGWRQAWVVAGIVTAIVVVGLSRLLHDRPASLGQQLDGDAAPAEGDVPRAAAVSWTRAQAARTPMFWLITAAVSAVGMIGTGLNFHQISLLGERGLTVTEAAANFVPQTVAGLLAVLAAGWLVDRIRPRWLVVGSMAGLAGAMGLAQVLSPGWSAVAYGMAVGASGGAIRSMEAAAFPRFFGLGHVGAIRGLVIAISVGATAFGPLALAAGFDASGSYGPVLTWLMVIPAAVAVAAFVVPVPGRPPG
jgi:sugar phosphate permease